jgi:hypothetical protein
MSEATRSRSRIFFLASAGAAKLCTSIIIYILFNKRQKLWVGAAFSEPCQIYPVPQSLLIVLDVRSSTSLDELAIDFEGDSYPLNELAGISKKDPKRYRTCTAVGLQFVNV